MDLGLKEEQRALQTLVRELVEKHCTAEWLDDLERREEYPFELFTRFAEVGLFGVGVPEDEGGYGGGLLEVALVSEQLGHVGGSVGMTYMPTGVFGVQTLLGAGSPQLKARFLPAMVAGELRTAFALTEPEAGSDAAAVKTKAVRAGDRWTIDGAKIFSSGAHVADYLVLTARTSAWEDRRRGLTVFLVDARHPGVTITGIPKLGHNAVQTCEIGLTEVDVPDTDVVGEVDEGWHALGNALDAERIATAALSVGLAQRCTDMALSYARDREQFGRPIASFQAISHLLAEMQTETAAARWLTYDAAWRKDQGLPCSKEASMAKAYATECGTRSASRGMQILGGYSYTKEYEMERFYREAKLYEVAGGATQIQRNIIAHHMGI